MAAKFLLLLGVSAVGKSTIIRELRTLDSRFTYISPYTTRMLREGEVDKVHVSDEEMDAMDARGEFVVVNNIYGIRYGTPRWPIIQSLETGLFPVLDWPIHKIGLMQAAFPLFSVYVAPPSIEELRRRLSIDQRDASGSRLQHAVLELEQYLNGDFSGKYDLSVVSENESIPLISKQIYHSYTQSLT